MISFELDDDQRLTRETARGFADARLWPKIRDHEAARALAPDVLAEAHALGLTTLAVPERDGGAGLGLVTQCLVEEELARGDAGACWALGGPQALLPFVLELGTEAQASAVLSRFTPDGTQARRGAVAISEARPAPHAGYAARATRDGDAWSVRGQKAFVTNGGLADAYVVLAQVDDTRGLDGIGAFVVDGRAGGIAALRRKTVGLDAAYVADVEFRGAPAIRLDGPDFSKGLARALIRHALVVAARAIGLSQRAWDLTRNYCEERTAFGKPIGHFQAVAFTVADRLMDVEAARWLVWQAAAKWDHGKADLAQSAGAAAQALECALKTTDDGIQLFGGAGFIRDYAVEKCFRDARQLTLMGPSIASLDALTADLELGRGLDLASFVPTGDIQPVGL